MKNNHWVKAGIAVCIAFSACTNKPATVSHGRHSLTDSFSRFIAVDSANKMIGSYLKSIDYTVNDTDLQSLIIDVNQLRSYIDSMPTSASITSIKLMFAHTLAYANSSRTGTYAGYNDSAMTLVIAAYDANGNYVLYIGNTVLDYAQPCPPICPSGNAANPLILNLSNAH
jgi:hypothetical protein